MDAAMQETAIRQRAYAIWEAEGRPEGREWDHWVQASQEVLRHPSTAAPTPVAKPRKRATARIKAARKSVIST